MSKVDQKSPLNVLVVGTFFVAAGLAWLYLLYALIFFAASLRPCSNPAEGFGCGMSLTAQNAFWGVAVLALFVLVTAVLFKGTFGAKKLLAAPAKKKKK